MKTRAETQKHLVLMLLVLVIICVSACQPTPDNEIVQQRDDFEELVQNTAQPKSSRQPEQTVNESQATDSEAQPSETPEPLPKYQETLEFEDGTFKVIIDAMIDKPDTPIPVAKVEPYLFTQKDADRVIDVLMHNKPIYRYEDEHNLKEWFQREIFEVNTVIATIKSDTNIDERTRNSLIEYYNNWISSLEQIEENSSVDLPEWNNITTDFVRINDMQIGLNLKCDMGKVLPARFILSINDDQINSSMGFSNTGTTFAYTKLWEITDDIQSLETTFDEALNLAKDTLESLGVEQMVLDYVDLGTIPFRMDVNSIKELVQSPYFPKWYTFHFTREINGVQAPYIQVCKGFEQDGPSYDMNWDNEQILVSVDDTGIIDYYYMGPSKIIEMINENVEVLDFDTVMDIFKKQIFYEGVWTAPNVEFSQLNITKIQLNMFRLKLKDKNEYMYVPVWDFIGNWKTNNYATEPGKEFSFLTINAIDGSIINRLRGY